MFQAEESAPIYKNDTTTHPWISFTINYGSNLIISFTSRNRWFDEPAEGECSSSTWYIIRFDIRNGIRKCMVKNLLNVASPTMNPPHSHLPIGCPTTKITLTKFVITVAAQKLICPQGNTYPTKAVRKVKRNTTTPVSQTLSYRSETY